MTKVQLYKNIKYFLAVTPAHDTQARLQHVGLVVQCTRPGKLEARLSPPEGAKLVLHTARACNRTPSGREVFPLVLGERVSDLGGRRGEVVARDAQLAKQLRPQRPDVVLDVALQVRATSDDERERQCGQRGGVCVWLLCADACRQQCQRAIAVRVGVLAEEQQTATVMAIEPVRGHCSEMDAERHYQRAVAWAAETQATLEEPASERSARRRTTCVIKWERAAVGTPRRERAAPAAHNYGSDTALHSGHLLLRGGP